MVTIVWMVWIVHEWDGDRIVKEDYSPVRMFPVHVGVLHIPRLGSEDTNMVTLGENLLFDLPYCECHAVVNVIN